MRRKLIGTLLSLIGLTVVACEEQTPTSIEDDLLPEEPVTVEILIPWEDFASDLQVIGGFGSPSELGTGVLANSFAGTLNARTLLRFGAYPEAVAVRDTTGTTRQDSSLTFFGGRVVAFFDTIASTNEDPVMLGLGALQHEWDVSTVSWTTAVDTINDTRQWPEAGAGPVAHIGTVEWDPAAGDSIWFELDSAQVAAWADTTNSARGARIDLLTEGARVQLLTAVLRLNTRPSLNPDSTFLLVSPREEISFVYDPFPDPPPDGIRIGGAPAWRTVLDIEIPTELNGPDALCARVGCPATLKPFELNYAAIVLHTRETEAAFQPTDTVGLDVRPVLSREALPKAPLGNSLIGSFGQRVPPEVFGEEDGAEIEIPITLFARDLIAGIDGSGFAPPETLALLAILEPVSIAFASFHGPGSELAPFLKLIVTVGRAVELP